MADMCSMVHLVYLFMKMHLLVLLQNNCLDLVCCAFLCNLSAFVRNITAFYQHLLRPVKLVILANTDILAKPKYRLDIFIGQADISISSFILYVSRNFTEAELVKAALEEFIFILTIDLHQKGDKLVFVCKFMNKHAIKSP